MIFVSLLYVEKYFITGFFPTSSQNKKIVRSKIEL